MSVTLKVGKTYKVKHSRKGSFTMKITEVGDEFSSGIVVEGKAQAMMDYNEKEVGERLDFRNSFITKAEEIAS